MLRSMLILWSWARGGKAEERAESLGQWHNILPTAAQPRCFLCLKGAVRRGCLKLGVPACPGGTFAPQAITLAHELAMACHATLQVLQVIEPDKITSYPLEAGAGLYHNLEAVKVLLRKRLADIVPDIPEGPPVERLIQEGNAAEVIWQESAARRADLIVMSAHAYGVVQKFFTVSTVDTVLAQAPCPLLAVPIPRFGR
jgi:nucleotide-binding universal stress UspA family protein